jgi:predicted hydrocarbon binding protein
MTTTERPTLGNFMSLTCFQYLRVGTEEVADRAPIVSAGRKRGSDLIEGLGLLGSTTDPSIIFHTLEAALGAKGTRLCLINSITIIAPGNYEVRLTEGACTTGQTSSEPLCAFTLGVFVGAIYAITGMAMRGREIQCCACGASECVYKIEAISL